MNQEITALKAQKKNPNRISVYLEGEYAFGLARIVAAWLRIGQQLSDEEINRLKQQDTQEVAYLKALRFLGYRARSEAEIQRKLSEQGYEENVINAAIQRLMENGFLGDEQFARDWVENRTTFRPRSKRMLALELRQKGVGEEAIQQALAETGDEDNLAYQSAIKYAHRLAGVDWETFRKRLGAYLMRRGFSYGTIAPVLRQVWDETQSSAGDNLTQNEDDEYD
ncbi:MAG: RecX family transcriptional regulator [Chloroflexi bacterium]|nr:MAG: RecX family transcriptional regulator [Chloroflexota bacterium]